MVFEKVQIWEPGDQHYHLPLPWSPAVAVRVAASQAYPADDPVSSFFIILMRTQQISRDDVGRLDRLAQIALEILNGARKEDFQHFVNLLLVLIAEDQSCQAES